MSASHGYAMPVEWMDEKGEKFSVVVVPTYHPSPRNRDFYYLFEKDIKAVSQVLNPGGIPNDGR